MKPRLNVLIYGGGAVGSIFGWRVAERGHKVTVVCRSNYEKVRSDGYRLKTNAWGYGRFSPSQVLRSGYFSRFDASPFDYIVCANKITDDYSSTLRDLRTLVHPHTTLVSAQNGMDTELPLHKAFPSNTILSAVCNIGCSQVRPGYVEQTASIQRPAFLLGIYHKATESHRRRRDQLVAVDNEFEATEAVLEERWRKLIFNSAWNSTTALSGLDTHQLLQRPGAAELVQRLATEAHRVAAASGVKLDDNLPAKTVELARSSAAIMPSTLQDARNRRPLELGPIFGYIVSQAAKVGVHVPSLQQVYSLLQQRNSAHLAQRHLHEPLWTYHRHPPVIDLLSMENDLLSAMSAT